MKRKYFASQLSEKGLKVTSRRLLILEAVTNLKHPTTDEVLRYVRVKQPGIATATVYKALNALVEKQVLIRVTLDKDVNRYDAVIQSHHHLYCTENNRIEDYNNDELTAILRNYFRKKKIKGFRIDDFKLQIIGTFTD